MIQGEVDNHHSAVATTSNHVKMSMATIGERVI